MATPKNLVGLNREDYKGLPSTLCTGCGHDTLNSAIMTACFDLSVDPTQLIRMSGIGCSSKSPAYIMERSFAFNTVHGRMSTIATGAACANHTVQYLGYSGDGDTASIGLGNFLHMVRRNLNIAYIMENNGTYGLTKGQFSATAKRGAKTKYGSENVWPAFDVSLLAIEAGATFVAKGFVIDRNQLISLLKAAMSHDGFAFLDVISPCVSYMNHDGSVMSYNWVKDNRQVLQDLEYVEKGAEPKDVPAGSEVLTFANGSRLIVKPKSEASYNFRDPAEAHRAVATASQKDLAATGLLYYREGEKSLAKLLNLGEKALTQYTEDELRLSEADFKKVVGSFR